MNKDTSRDAVAKMEDVDQEKLDGITSNERVFQYTRTYRVATTLTDAELIQRARMFYGVVDATKGLSGVEPETRQDAIDVIIDIMTKLDIGNPTNVKIELHNTQLEERDPGFF